MTFTVGMKVRDRWWPWRLGIVRKVTKTTVRVQWVSGTPGVWTDTFDLAHQKFLEDAMTTKTKQWIQVTITAKFEVEDGGSLKSVLECIDEAMDKLREEGAAEGKVKLSGESEFTL